MYISLFPASYSAVKSRISPAVTAAIWYRRSVRVDGSDSFGRSGLVVCGPGERSVAENGIVLSGEFIMHLLIEK
jgi:hypothetical protein